MQRIVRPSEAIERLGISKTMFWDEFVMKGRLRLRRVGPKAVGMLETEFNELIETLPLAEDGNPGSEAATRARAEAAAATETAKAARARAGEKRSATREPNRSSRGAVCAARKSPPAAA